MTALRLRLVRVALDSDAFASVEALGLAGSLVAGRSYRLMINLELDGLLLIDATEGAVAYLAQSNSWAAMQDRVWTIEVHRRRFSWDLALSDARSSRQFAVSRPKLRPGAYRISDQSARPLRLSALPLSPRWVLRSDRGPIARIRTSRWMRSPTSSPIGLYDERPAAEVVMMDGAASLRSAGPVTLLAIATIRAEMTIPTVELAGPGG